LLVDLWPCLGKFSIQLDPLVCACITVCLDCLGWTFWYTHSAINALVRIDYQHVLPFVETVHRAHTDTICVLAFDTIIVDYIGHCDFLIL